MAKTESKDPEVTLEPTASLDPEAKSASLESQALRAQMASTVSPGQRAKLGLLALQGRKGRLVQKVNLARAVIQALKDGLDKKATEAKLELKGLKEK